MATITDLSNQLFEVNQNVESIDDTLFDIRSESLVDISNSLFDIFDFLVDSDSSSLEERREQSRQNDRMIAALEGGGAGAAGSDIGGSEDDSGGGLLGGLGLAGAGLGIGAAGIGALFAGGGYLLDQIVNMDAEGLKQNILTLLSIPDEVGGTGSFFVEGGAFFVAMTGLGAGLAAFALGSGVSAAVNYFTEDSDFAETIKNNVKTLLSIPEEIGGNLSMLAKGGAFTLAMTGLGLGLAAFGVGSSIAGLSDALTNFSSPDWAQSIRDNVLTLLSISDAVGGIGGALKEGGTFFLAMTGLAGGLAVFSAGSAIAGAVDLFTDPAWAQSIKENVLTLLSIDDALGGKLAAFGESGSFLAIMTGLGAGLAAFGIGQTANAIASTISKPDWSQNIKNNVASLLSITDMLDGDGEDSSAGRFAAGMAKIAAGLLAFTGSKAIGQLANVGEKVLGFFGVDSPFDQIMDVADNSDDLMKGAVAIERISDALGKFSSIDVSTSDIDFSGLAKNLGRSIPLIQKLADGGTYDPGFFSGSIDFGKGLLDPSLKLDELAEQVVKVNYVLGRSTTPPATQSLDLDRRPSGQLNMAAEESQSLQGQQSTGSGNVNVQNTTANNVTNNSQTVVKPVEGPTRPPRTAKDTQFSPAQ